MEVWKRSTWRRLGLQPWLQGRPEPPEAPRRHFHGMGVKTQDGSQLAKGSSSIINAPMEEVEDRTEQVGATLALPCPAIASMESAPLCTSMDHLTGVTGAMVAMSCVECPTKVAKLGAGAYEALPQPWREDFEEIDCRSSVTKILGIRDIEDIWEAQMPPLESVDALGMETRHWLNMIGSPSFGSMPVGKHQLERMKRLVGNIVYGTDIEGPCSAVLCSWEVMWRGWPDPWIPV